MRAVAVVLCNVVVVLGAGFGGDGVGLLMHQRQIPGGGHADGLRKYRRGAVGDAMKAFIPMAIGRKAKPRNAGGIATQLRHFFDQRHPAHQVMTPRVKRL